MNKQDTCGLWMFMMFMVLIPSYTILTHLIPSDTYGQIIRWVNRKQQTYLRGHTLLGIKIGLVVARDMCGRKSTRGPPSKSHLSPQWEFQDPKMEVR